MRGQFKYNKNMDNLEQIKKAVEIEVKYKYININGRTRSFSSFICSELRKEIKKSKNPKWQVLLEHFERYQMDTLPQRKKSLERLVSVIKAETGETQPKKAHSNLSLKSDVMYLKGIGPKIAYVLNKLGIYTVGDLLYYFPRKHVDYSTRTRIRDLEPGETTTVFGNIRSVEAFTTKNNLGVVKVRINDGSGSMSLNFFASKSNKFTLERMKQQFPKGAGIMVSGTVKINSYDGMPTLDKPVYSIMEDEILGESNINLARIVPIYPLSENLNIKTLRRAIFNTIQLFKNDIETVLPRKVIEKYNLMEKREAVEQMHFPKDNDSLHNARYSLVFEELFLIQLKLALLREENNKSISSIPLEIKKDGLVMRFINSLPFELTGAQKRAVNEILNDLNSTKPMQRLLQGDVGSGKTIIAFLAMILACENGYQATLMAPTEVLARQHYDGFLRLQEEQGLNFHVVLLTGSNTAREKREIYQHIASGEAQIIIGTHALIQEKVEYHDLALVVTDEQHRFGVKQREALTTRGNPPNILVMSATPIPRTLAIILYGDLDISIIDELPAKRLPIKNCVVNTSYRPKAYAFIQRQVREGRQAYIICPMVEESEGLDAENVLDYTRKLKGIFPSDINVSFLHGKMKPKEKNEIMEKFAANEIQVLVSTTVVEVGVNVPNATVMMVENAERFGLAQLHQLRGRVGRGEYQSYCIFIQGSDEETTSKRLDILNKSNDGFYIAGEDLKLRGPGDLFGIRQSGDMEFRIGDIYNDSAILKSASEAAAEILSLDPDLSLEQHRALKHYLLKRQENASDGLGL